MEKVPPRLHRRDLKPTAPLWQRGCVDELRPAARSRQESGPGMLVGFRPGSPGSICSGTLWKTLVVHSPSCVLDPLGTFTPVTHSQKLLDTPRSS